MSETTYCEKLKGSRCVYPIGHGGASPCLGADTDQVLQDLLAIEPAQIAAWKAAKVLW